MGAVNIFVDGTPLAFTNQCLLETKAGATGATEEQQHRLETVRRLLLRVEAIRASSWLWYSGIPPGAQIQGIQARPQ